MTTNRSVLITGASTGIGAACALALDGLGWQVFAGIRDPRAAERLREEASERLVPVRLDVTSAEEIAAAAQQVDSVVGQRGLDGLVNNAGMVVPGPLEAVPIDGLRRQLEVNVVGQIAVTQAMLPLLRRGAGRIVMMSSVSGRVAPPYLGAYAASKHALEGAADALRLELRRWKIRVALVEPGSVDTPIWDKAQSKTQNLAEGLAPELTALYDEDLRVMQRVTEDLAASGMPVRRVVDAVVHALTARRPRIRYPVGAQTKLAVRLLPLAADWMRDAIVRRALGLRD